MTLFVCGCVETPAATDARAEAHALDQPARVAVDDFWLDQQIAAFDEKPAERPRSISLGYAGDTPLSGGVMRDTPINYYPDNYQGSYPQAVYPPRACPPNYPNAYGYGYAPPGYR
ncbi:MAG: hypothetical protein ABI183_04020 [Polyangiaceae bacterium]